MAARAIWKAVLNVGPATVPVKLYSAVEDRAVHFNLLDAASETRVKQHMVDPETGAEVPKEEIRKGYQFAPGSFVILDPEDLQAVEPEASRDISVVSFVPPEVITHQWYERPYYLGPDGDDAAYFALAEALEKRNREGFAKWVMRKKHYTGALRAADGYLMLITLRKADEVLSAHDLPQPGGRAPDPREIKMAEQLIQVLEDEFRPEDFSDEYRERVLNYIEQKAKGQKPKLVSIKEKKPAASLTGVLEASLKAAKQQKGKRVA
jgi:DNA end-binding protein Ku